MEEEKREEDVVEKTNPPATEVETLRINGTRPVAAIVLAALSIVFAVVQITVTIGDGLSFGISIVSSLAGGFGGAYMIYALLWDVIFVVAPIIALNGICVWNQNTKNLLVAAMSMGVAILVLNLLFGLFILFSGISALKYFNLMEYIVLAAQTSFSSLFLQFLIYGGALIVFIVAIKAKKDNAKIAIVGLSIVAVIALILTIAGLQPFAYSIGGYSVLGYTVPQSGMYFLNEFLSYVLLWAAAVVCIVQMSKKSGEAGDGIPNTEEGQS